MSDTDNWVATTAVILYDGEKWLLEMIAAQPDGTLVSTPKNETLPGFNGLVDLGFIQWHGGDLTVAQWRLSDAGKKWLAECVLSTADPWGLVALNADPDYQIAKRRAQRMAEGPPYRESFDEPAPSLAEHCPDPELPDEPKGFV